MFHVAKDLSRPFIVNAAGTRVTAVGKVFSVSRIDDSVVVTVTEGRVKVTRAAEPLSLPGVAPRFAEVSLQANERVTVSAEGNAGAIGQVEESKASTWVEKPLVFDNARVDAVVMQFNRINRVKIRISDRTLNSRTISGVFAPSDPRSFVEFLKTVVGVESTDDGPDQILVRPITPGSEPPASSH
jgi:transmembrane sensor